VEVNIISNYEYTCTDCLIGTMCFKMCEDAKPYFLNLVKIDEDFDSNSEAYAIKQDNVSQQIYREQMAKQEEDTYLEQGQKPLPKSMPKQKSNSFNVKEYLDKEIKNIKEGYVTIDQQIEAIPDPKLKEKAKQILSGIIDGINKGVTKSKQLLST